MNLHDDDIDRVLGALRAAEPVDGMEARILRRLAQRAERRVASPWSLRMRQRWIAYALGAGAVFAVGALVVVHRPHAVAPRRETAQSVAAQAALAADRRPEVVAVVVRRTSERHLRGDRAAAVRATAAAGGEQSAAESFPAPPMPLTEQERLLVRIADRGSARPRVLPTAFPLGTEVAELRADTDKFFEDPTTGENQWKQIVAAQAAPN